LHEPQSKKPSVPSDPTSLLANVTIRESRIASRRPVAASRCRGVTPSRSRLAMESSDL
jgi:hypothetical protein